MNDIELLISHSIFSNKGVYALFLGSGTSRSAGIPTAWEIILKLIERLATLNNHSINGHHEKWFKTKYGFPPDYSQIIELLTNTSEERVNLLKPFFEATSDEIQEGIKMPTAAHRAIAQLIQKGYIRVVITTNFDRLMENALREIGMEATIISNPNHIENVMPLIHSPITIIKVNGDYLDTKFLNIESELSRYDPSLQELLKYIFENFGLITTGWSAKWDTGLREILQISNKFRFSNYFTYLNNCEDELRQLSVLRNGKLVQIKDANNFYTEILENVEALEMGEKNNPLSKPVAIARLKKYIQNPNKKIELYELITDELKMAFTAVNSQSFPFPEITTIKAVIEFDINRLNLLYSMIMEGVYWGNTLHHEIWIGSISKLAHPIRPASSYSIWSSLSLFPALILFYAIGLTALFRRDFLLLCKLYSAQIFNYYNEGEKIPFLKNVNIKSVIEPPQLKEVYGTTQYVPMSEMLYKLFKIEFENRIANEFEYNELFDCFEFLTCLQYILQSPDRGLLYGRFVHTRRSKNHIIITKFEDLNSQKENLDWIKEGLFKDVATLNKAYQYFNENMNGSSY